MIRSQRIWQRVVAHADMDAFYPGDLGRLGKTAGIDKLRHRRIRVVRDYGRFDRREAPQFYPDIKGAETKHPEPAH